MARFRVTCPNCTVESTLVAEEISLNICQMAPAFSFYAWACPGCLRFNYSHAGMSTIDMLVSNGVTARPHQRPDRHGAPSDTPLTEDDLITFGREIEALPSGVEPQRQRTS